MMVKAPSCHQPLTAVEVGAGLRIALAGNPNVGKSSLFNSLTGLGVETANYPGKTVEVQRGQARFGDLTLALIDLPGTYALDGVSEDQWVARQALLDGEADVVILVADATNLERNLYLALQLLELELPMVIALNVVDQAERHGIRTDPELLGELLGVPVIPTVATRGTGIERLMAAAIEAGRRGPGSAVGTRLRYAKHVEEALASVARAMEEAPPLFKGRVPARALALLLVAGDPEMAGRIRGDPLRSWILEVADRAARAIADAHGEPAAFVLARERHGLAGLLATQVQRREPARPSLPERLWRWTTAPVTGIPILLLVLAGIFGTLFYLGDLLSTLLGNLWAAYASPVIRYPIGLLLGEGVLARTLLWAVDAGINAALAVGVPYVFTFYLILAVLEDTGYLNAVAFLTDQLMHKVGLHGRAAIPLVAGAGCNVPAIMGTRVLRSMRERVIASTLICLVPCSARTAVILGAVAATAGWRAAVAVYVITFLISVATGIGMNRILPGRGTGLVMEMFPFRTPTLGPVLKKTWHRFRNFVLVATPIVLLGSLFLGALYESGLLWSLARPLAPIMEGWLGLPAVAGLTLVVAVLRKELALQLLVTLAMVQYGPAAQNLLAFMSPRQLFVYALVNTIYIPCIATIAVLGKELGWRRAILISAFTISLALLAGGIAQRALALVGWL